MPIKRVIIEADKGATIAQSMMDAVYAVFKYGTNVTLEFNDCWFNITYEKVVELLDEFGRTKQPITND